MKPLCLPKYTATVSVRQSHRTATNHAACRLMSSLDHALPCFEQSHRLAPVANRYDMGNQTRALGTAIFHSYVHGNRRWLTGHAQQAFRPHIESEWVAGRRRSKGDGTAEARGNGAMDVTGHNALHLSIPPQ